MLRSRKYVKMSTENNQNVVVLFEVKPTPAGRLRYLELAAELKELLAGAKGFIRAERFASLNEEGKLLSMNIWESENDVEVWRNTLAHRMCQLEGRAKLFESYRITVACAIREYSDISRRQAPEDSNEYFSV